MNKIYFFVLFLIVSILGNKSLCAADIIDVSQALKKMDIVVTDKVEQIEIELPLKFAGPNWGLKESIWRKSGWDLSAYAGKKVFFTCFHTNEKYESEPLDVWVVSDNDKVLCVYKTVRKDSSMAPGIFPVINPTKIK